MVDLMDFKMKTKFVACKSRTEEERRLRLFENRVLKIIFGPERDEITGELRRLHNEELNNLYCSSNIIWVNESRRLRWVGHVARMGRRKLYTGFWWGNLRERNH
jgi:predicted ATP-grasp superfamily ATP-dependent carboligase